MDIEPAPEADYKHELFFYGDEVEALVAAFREHIYQKASKGNSDSITEIECNIADALDDDSEGISFVIEEDIETEVTAVLTNFYDRTGDAVSQIPEQTNTPPFLSTEITRRIYLAKVALRLAEEITEKITVADFQQGLESASPEDFAQDEDQP